MRPIEISMLNVYSTIVMRVEGERILFDPVEIDPYQFDDLSVIVISHEHVDHFDKNLVLELQKQTGAKILTTPFVQERLKSSCRSITPMKPGDSDEIEKNVTICAERSNHNANEALTFFIKSKTATVFYPNDSACYPKLASLREKYKPSVIVFVGNSMKNLVAFGMIMKPKVIVTYDYPDISSIDLPDTNVVTLKQFEWYQIPDNCCAQDDR
jgi:L-ascorbate metabolism protein UlaG (beta-lactamase superfamily)